MPANYYFSSIPNEKVLFLLQVSGIERLPRFGQINELGKIKIIHFNCAGKFRSSLSQSILFQNMVSDCIERIRPASSGRRPWV